MPKSYQTVHFIQDNQSLSMQKGTLRGIHFQNNPKAQTKLVRCILEGKNLSRLLITFFMSSRMNYQQLLKTRAEDAGFSQS